MSINRVFITGNLTRDSELRTTATGMSVLGFSVAVNDRTKDASTGEWKDRASFVDCTVFGRRADALARLLGKGQKVAVAGRLRQTTWERDGQKRSKLEVVADDVELMSRRDDGKQAATGHADTFPIDASLYDADIPF
ncbi:single-stranded DNA-binding protein [Slackia exigua]|uniref:single-stranded DNA-binding protein n=1 Tax=Slackia exigua TaxID=84109 RepID=UPI0023F365D6|nr:single-stranded DNA-binding protein [Slackia exigua]